jgi:SAM-dependent methyltransferase
MLPTLLGLGGEVVATDLDAATLARPTTVGGSSRLRRVAANLFHLPFRDGSFTAATMVRVYHHLLDPVAAFREVGRVLHGGARFVVSYKPRPSLGTLIDDVGRAVRRDVAPFRSLTAARVPVVIDARPFPMRTSSRREFEQEVRAGELRVTDQAGLGLEEYTLLRRAPTNLFVRMSSHLGRAPGFPTRFAVLERTGSPPATLPPLDSLLACPRCRIGQPTWWNAPEPRCAGCGFEGQRSDGVLDLRYVPPDAVRWGV